MKPSFELLDFDQLLSLETEQDLYNHISDQYNEIADTFYGYANRELLKQLRLNDQTKLVDLACGTGHAAIEIAKKIPNGKVVGVDLAPDMLARGRREATAAGLNNVEFIQGNIHDLLPELKRREFNIGMSCFALSYLGCDFLLKELYDIVGENGQVGVTTSSMNCLVEWQPIFLELVMAHADKVQSFGSMPLHAEDLKERMEQVGFKKVQVISKQIPLVFKNAHEAGCFLVTAGFISSYFFHLDQKERKEMFQWAVKKIDEHHEKDGKVVSSIEFLVAWNQP